MGGMLRAIASDHLIVARVASQGESGLEDVVTWFHEHQDTLHLFLPLFHAHPGTFADILDQFVLDDLTSTMKEVFDHVEELWVRF